MNLWISAYWPLWDWVIDSPSWLNTYIHWVILEAKKRWDKVFWLQDNLDWENPIFNWFYDELRKESFDYITFVDIDKEEMPKLDSLYLEWRWPIPWRNDLETYKRKLNWEKVNFNNDLIKQQKILDKYLKEPDVKVFIYDMDYKLTKEDEIKIANERAKYTKNWELFKNLRVLDLSLHPTNVFIPRISAPTPFDIDKLKEHWLKNLRYNYLKDWTNPDHLDNNVVLSYIWNNYERNDVIEKYIEITANNFKWKVHFYWNWEKYPKVLEDLKQKYKFFQNICFHPRITKQWFDHVYSLSLACPLFLKKVYMDWWVITQRILEAINWWTIVIWLRDTKYIEEVVQEEMIADDANSLYSIVLKLLSQNREERKETYLKQFEYLKPFNTKTFYEKLI